MAPLNPPKVWYGFEFVLGSFRSIFGLPNLGRGRAPTLLPQGAAADPKWRRILRGESGRGFPFCDVTALASTLNMAL